MTKPTNNSINNGAGNPNCSSKKTAVQVTGIGHKKGQSQHQSLKMYRVRGEKSRKEHDPKTITEINAGTHIPSTIFTWDKKVKLEAGQTLSLELEIATEQGNPICLPLTEYFTPDGDTPTVDEYYLTNRLYAITPMVDLADFDTEKEITQFAGMGGYTQTTIPKSSCYVPCRLGYFYIFLNGRLWRELFISRNEQEENIYQDINLNDYRTKDEQTGHYIYKNGERNPTGKPLADIWIPGAFYASRGRQTCIVYTAYSDVPWSAERISYFEKNLGERNKRMQSFAWNTKETDNYFPAIFSRVLKPQYGKAFPQLDRYIKKVRARAEDIEFMLDNPHRFLMEEDYLQKSLQATKDTIKAMENGQHATSLNKETGAWQYLCLQNKKELSEAEQKDLEALKEFWETTSAFTDIMETPKKRGIWGILVKDPHYIIAHHKYRIQTSIQLFSLLADQAKKHEYHALASFIEKQRSFIPSFDEGVKDDMGGEGLKRYQKAVSLLERKALEQLVTKWKENIAIQFKEDVTVSVFADMLSNYDNPTDLIGHYNHLADTLGLITLGREKYDPFAAPKEGYSKTEYKRSPEKFIYEAFINTENRLHQLLWPKVTPEEIEKPYEPSTQPATNDGSGKYNSTVWEKIVRQDALKDGQPSQLNGVTILGVKHFTDHAPLMDTQNKVYYFKGTANILFTVVGKMGDVVKHVQLMALHSSDNWQAAQTALKEAQTEHHKRAQDLKQAARKEGDTLDALKKYQTKIDACKTQLLNIEEAFEQQLERAGVVKARLNIPHAQMIRVASGNKLYNLQYRLIDARRGLPSDQLKGYRILGVLPDTVATNRSKKVTEVKRKFELFDLEQGNQLSHQNTKGLRQSVYIAVIPENDPYLKIRDRAVREQIPELEKQMAHNKVRAHHTRNRLTELIEQRVAAQTTEQAASSVLDESALNETQKGSIFRLRRNSAAAWEKVQRLAARIERTGIVPPALLALEAWNVINLMRGMEQQEINRGVLRADIGLLVAGGDLIIASAIVFEEIQASYYTLNNLGKAPLKMFMSERSKLLSQLLKRDLARRLIPMGGLVILNIGLNLWDMTDAILEGDSAGFAHAVLALSGVAMLFGLYAEGSSPILGFGPVGWLIWSVGLILAGVALLIFFEDSELEKWFKQGPFGGSPDPRIQQQGSAFAALLNIFNQPQVNITDNPYQEQAKTLLANQTIAETHQDYAFVKAIAAANACIAINSGFMSFEQHDVSIKYEARCYNNEQWRRIIMSEHEDEDTIEKPTVNCTPNPNGRVLYSETLTDGIILFVYTPNSIFASKKETIPDKVEVSQEDYNRMDSYPRYYVSGRSKTILSSYRLEPYWLVAVQVQTSLNELTNEENIYYFPAPSYKEQIPYNANLHGQAVFSEKISFSRYFPDEVNNFEQHYWFTTAFGMGKIVDKIIRSN